MSSSPSQPLAGRRIWIAGIGGAGMSGYALLARAWGADKTFALAAICVRRRRIAEARRGGGRADGGGDGGACRKAQPRHPPEEIVARIKNTAMRRFHLTYGPRLRRRSFLGE